MDCSLERYECEFAGMHRLDRVVAKWAAERPDAPALIHHDRGGQLTWRELDEHSTALALELIRMGFRKGDFLAASLPFLTGHVLLEYACFKIGVIHAPLDLRLPPAEVLRCLNLLRPRGYAFPGRTRAADFGELGRAVMRHCPFVAQLIQFAAPEETIEGAESFFALGAGRRPEGLENAFARMNAAVTEHDGALAIFTPGSTGAPKPALLSHRNITCQNMCLGAAFGFDTGTRLLRPSRRSRCASAHPSVVFPAPLNPVSQIAIPVSTRPSFIDFPL